MFVTIDVKQARCKQEVPARGTPMIAGLLRSLLLTCLPILDAPPDAQLHDLEGNPVNLLSLLQKDRPVVLSSIPACMHILYFPWIYLGADGS